MDSQKSASNSKKRERVRMYKKKQRTIEQLKQRRVGRIYRLKQKTLKSNKKLITLSSQITAL